MVTKQASSNKQLRKWQTGHIWLLSRFRNFVELETKAAKAKDDGMKRHWWDKRSHIWNKIQDHEQRAPEEIQVEEFTQTVLKMIAQGKHPKQILGELGEERVKKDRPPSSSPRPHRLVA